MLLSNNILGTKSGRYGKYFYQLHSLWSLQFFQLKGFLPKRGENNKRKGNFDAHFPPLSGDMFSCLC